MNFDQARETALALLKAQGRAKNSELLAAIGGDQQLLLQVREDLIFNDVAKDKDGVGLIASDPAPVVADVAPTSKPRVFLSYGRRDAAPLVDRLCVDLAAAGFELWRDTREIRSGQDWQSEIVDGLRAAQVVVAVMTPHSVRTTRDATSPDQVDSVCLGEIAYALFNPPPQPVVPVMAHTCEPPLCIFHLDYVDLRAWQDSESQYRAGLQRLMDGIHAALRGEKRYRSWHHQLNPFDFASFLYSKRRDFCGRQWLFDKLDAWRAASGRERALLIKGGPGVGKSAIVAELVHRNPDGQVLAYHCCQWNVGETLKPGRFVRSLAAMIASKVEGYAQLLQHDPSLGDALAPTQCESDPGSALEAGVFAPLEKVPAPDGGPRYILIDALDESLLVSPGAETIVSLLASRLDRLPAWLRVVATTRDDPLVLAKLGGLRAEVIDTKSQDHLDDLRSYLDLRLATPNLAECLTHAQLGVPRVRDLLMARSAGNFLYVSQALEALEKGQIDPQRLERLPPGLAALYANRFERQFPSDTDFAGPKRVLEALAAAQEPLSAVQLAAVTELDPDDALPVVLKKLAMYVPERIADDGQARYTFYHKSLSDWLVDPERRGLPYSVNPKTGHRRLAHVCWAEYTRAVNRMSGYALRYLPEHLAAAERWDDLGTLLTDLLFLEAKTQAGQVFDLAGDFGVAVAAMPHDHPQRRILKLLEEALRRDIHFIARHAEDYPQGLFQCLWNTCWWYDCPEAANHYVTNRPPGVPVPAPGSASFVLGGWPPSAVLSGVPVPAAGSLSGTGRAPAANGGRQAPGDSGAALASGSGRARGGVEPGTPTCTLLERWRCEKEDRSPGFPWLRSLRPPAMHLGTAQLAVLRGHESHVTSVSYSPDGSRIVSGSEDKMVRVWDASSGAELAVLRGHENGVMSVSYSPDGSRIVSGSRDQTVRVWDAASGAELAVLRGHENSVNSVNYSPDGSRIVSGSGGFDSKDNTVRVWDASSGAELAVLRGHEKSVTSVNYSPDGSRIVSGSEDETVRVWDASSGAELAVLRGHKSYVTSVSYSPDGSRIVSGSDDDTVRVWDASSGAELAVLRGHKSYVTSVSYSPDGSRIVSGSGGFDSKDNTVRVWDASSGAELAVLRGHEGWVWSVSYSPDGSRIVSGSDDKTVRVWDASSGAELAVLRGHEGDVESVSYSPDGSRIVSGSGDETVRVWDAATGAELAALRGHKGSVNSVRYSPDGSRIVSGSYDTTVRVWDASSGAELAELRGHAYAVTSVCYSPDGSRIVSGSWDQTVRVWNASSGAELALLRGHETNVTSVSYSPDGSRIVSGSDDKTVRVWDAASGAEMAVLRGHEYRVESVSYSPDGSRIVSQSRYQTVRVWDAASGECLETIAGSGDVAAIARALPQSRGAVRAISRGAETIIEQSAGGRPLARYPAELDPITTSPTGRAWAGGVPSYLCIIRLEGAAT